MQNTWPSLQANGATVDACGRDVLVQHTRWLLGSVPGYSRGMQPTECAEVFNEHVSANWFESQEVCDIIRITPELPILGIAQLFLIQVLVAVELVNYY